MMQPPHQHSATDISEGYCARCGRTHALGEGDSRNAASQLMRQLESQGTIGLFSPDTRTNPDLSTSPLFGEARGKMFGVLECRTRSGKTEILYAFSGQYNRLYLVDGWAPPLFDVAEFNAVNDSPEKEIKELGRLIAAEPRMSALWLRLRKERREKSRALMQRLQSLYRLQNFRGETSSLTTAFQGTGGMPTGTGDCCAPKLLNQAAQLDLTPVGLCEFFWGRTNKSETLHHGMITSACEEKCAPILGFLLCGLESAHD